MGKKALEVGIPSQAAAIFFESVRMDRGLTKKEVFLGVGIAGSSRYEGLIKGTSVWTLDDVDRFSKFHNVTLKVVFREIEKGIHRLTSEKNFPYPFIEDSQVG